jgi:hypothetical protein
LILVFIARPEVTFAKEVAIAVSAAITTPIAIASIVHGTEEAVFARVSKVCIYGFAFPCDGLAVRVAEGLDAVVVADQLGAVFLDGFTLTAQTLVSDGARVIVFALRAVNFGLDQALALIFSTHCNVALVTATIPQASKTDTIDADIGGGTPLVIVAISTLVDRGPLGREG